MVATGSSARSALTDIEVVPMRRRHLRGVLAVEDLVYPQPWSPTLFVSEMTMSRRCYLVALELTGATGVRRSRRRVIGYAGLLLQADEAHITTVAVHPEQHRRKIASRLLVGLLTWARARRATAATLEVRVANRGAQRLYAGFGFAPVGVRPGYYVETKEDALIMWAHELQGAGFAELLDRQRARLEAPGGASGIPDLHVPWVRGRVGLSLSDLDGVSGEPSGEDRP